jgi:SAM-dependent methyltransferase
MVDSISNMAEHHVEIRSCGICGSMEKVELFVVQRQLHQYQNQITYKVVKCQDCGSVFLTPRPTSKLFALIYPDTYYAYQDHPQGWRSQFKGWVRRAGGGTRTPGFFGGLEHQLARRLSALFMTALPAAVGQQKILDIGCGSGEFLSQAKLLGWQTWGVEPSVSGARKAQQQGHQVFCGTLQQAHFPPKFFDFICLSHLIEHMDDPLLELRRCHEILRDDGKLQVVTPNFECFDRHTFGPYWKNLCIPQHLWFFSPTTMKNLLRRADFNMESFRLSLIPWKKDDLALFSCKFVLKERRLAGIELGRALLPMLFRTVLIKPWLYLVPGQKGFLADTFAVLATKMVS